MSGHGSYPNYPNQPPPYDQQSPFIQPGVTHNLAYDSNPNPINIGGGSGYPPQSMYPSAGGPQPPPYQNMGKSHQPFPNSAAPGPGIGFGAPHQALYQAPHQASYQAPYQQAPMNYGQGATPSQAYGSNQAIPPPVNHQPNEGLLPSFLTKKHKKHKKDKHERHRSGSPKKHKKDKHHSPKALARIDEVEEEYRSSPSL
uniref:Uncharacterized protein n=1 Tax=Acrobeloides nanus TaxID=290746 RepID=A0A914D9L1_9BILA